ncbi:Ribosomal protein S6 kinase beta-1 [Blyttiomyces sp. JEL0837]|nr:Ribosomal protein S6 kinase beta-1 [Blyttiomyces sp. JEL0837]
MTRTGSVAARPSPVGAPAARPSPVGTPAARPSPIGAPAVSQSHGHRIENSSTASPPGFTVTAPCKCAAMVTYPIGSNVEPCCKHKLPHRMNAYEFHYKYLGRGGFGVAFKARLKPERGGSRDIVFVAKVAKIDDNYACNDFKQEIKMYEHLAGHTFVPKFLGVAVDVDKKTACLFMEYLAGGDLQRRIADSQFGLTEEEVVFYGAVLVHILAEFATVGVIHRDIKPGNILIDKTGYPILADFGLAVNNRIANDVGVGTIPFMAPEILVEDNKDYYNRTVDYWSLGVTLFVMISRFSPYPFGIDVNDTREQVLNKVLNTPLEFPPDLDFSDELKDLLRGLLDIHPDVRVKFGRRLKEHRFFDSVDWEKLERRELVAPFVPTIPREFEDAGTIVEDVFTELAAAGEQI